MPSRWDALDVVEQALVLAHPLEQYLDPLFHVDLWLPAELALSLVEIGIEHALITRTPVGALHRDWLAQQLLQQRAELSPNRQDVARPAADVIDLSSGAIDLLHGKVIGARQVLDVQDIAHLLAIAIDGDVPPRHSRNGHPCQPALVFH